MFGKSVRLFQILGFEVKVDASWLIIAALVTWSLAAGLFPNYYGELSTRTHWLMGIVGALGLFVSIVFHELSHSLVARRYGIPMHGITLFIFGGVAEMHEEPPNAKSEFLMAAAGPVASALLGLACYGLSEWGRGVGWPSAVDGVIGYLGLINILLAGFNLVPAFPLDGGRMLRAVLWHWRQNVQWATRIVCRLGSGFGIVLMVLGVIQILTMNFIGGMWWVLIGLFLRGAAQMSYRQMVSRRHLEGEPVRRFMSEQPVTVPPDLPLRQLGQVTWQQLGEVPQLEWDQRMVADIMLPASQDNTIDPDTDAMEALARLRRIGASRLMVARGDTLAGILSLKDLMAFLSMKVGLEG